MKYLLATTALAFLAGCGGRPSDSASAAKGHADAIVKAEVAAANGGVVPTGTTPLKGDGPGCKDRTKAGELVVASKKDDQAEYIKLWAAGMQDYSCRGFAEGLGVKVDKVGADKWPCILPADDPDNKTCFWVEPGRAG